jgi:UDP-N-acetylmuramoylalanine--D-glutamate ligase
VPASIAARSRAGLKPFSLKDVRNSGIIWPDSKDEEVVLKTNEIPLAGRFNIQNVLAALRAAALCGVRPDAARRAIRQFRALPHRLELVGAFRGVTFYDDSIATVPEATLAALDALGKNVETLILGGHERNLDFSDLGMHLPAHVRTVILFPPTGHRIWQAIQTNSRAIPLPDAFFVDSMEQAVNLAYARTGKGKICLLSPASPSFGTFKDYQERGDWIRSSG